MTTVDEVDYSSTILNILTSVLKICPPKCSKVYSKCAQNVHQSVAKVQSHSILKVYSNCPPKCSKVYSKCTKNV